MIDTFEEISTAGGFIYSANAMQTLMLPTFLGSRCLRHIYYIWQTSFATKVSKVHIKKWQEDSQIKSKATNGGFSGKAVVKQG